MSAVIKFYSKADLLPVEVKPINLALVHAAPSAIDVDPGASNVAVCEAEAILMDARAEAETIRETAQEEGYRAGIAAGAEKAGELIERLQSDLAQLEQDRDSLVENIEPEVLKLCMEAVEKVIRHEIKADPRVVMRVIKSCLRRIKDSGEVYIRVSPQELEHVRACKDELLGLGGGVRTISIVDDRRVSPGGCVVESSSGDYDAQIETQLEKISKKFTETLRNEQTDSGSGPGEVFEGDQPA